MPSRSLWLCSLRMAPVAIERALGLEGARDTRQGAVTPTACAFYSWLQVRMARKTVKSN